MKRTMRFCINCREIFGCVTYGKTEDCMTCKYVNKCKLRFMQFDLKDVTGGICATCFFLYKAEKALKTASQAIAN